ncbi:FAD-dependent oxidoreductase [Nocardioides marmoriginsengisoli]|uniref:3-oxosteroid 1-dehydrogenase n=1 Tax=Nocardioides marmoriginsengisoli TaxID=661483 RepID=A0A3N0CB10_9ACTN|nr:FAD-dependent oxidoreductase [Nocardioides marmoriginsengisoli]RNL60608.1 FAD-dependent oxidoreductase [Nocardioides marmoriginsengisoli]
MTEQQEQDVDLVVVGSGAGGMVAALAARAAGLDVVLVEKAPWFGGTTALSGGGIWVPNNPTLVEAGVSDPEESVLTYLRALVGDAVDDARIRTYVQEGPKVMAWLEQASPHLRFEHVAGYSDYHPELPGGRPEGRTVEALPFDTTLLGGLARTMRRTPLAAPMGLYLTEAEYAAVAMMRRTWRGRRTALRMAGRGILDRVRRRRMVALGQALVGRLRLALEEAGVPVRLECELTGLVVADGRVRGVEVRRDGVASRLGARRGVVLASGGFDHNQQLRDAELPALAAADASGGANTNTGDGILAGRAIGAATDLMDDAWWMPVVRLPGDRIQVLVSERCIPGSLIVTPEGRRFVNESSPYVNFVKDQLRAGHRTVWLVMDARARSRYPFAGILPGQPFPRSWYESGLVLRSSSLDVLAGRIGVEADVLAATVDRFNEHAREGVDPDFARGESAYDRYYGDPTLPNPTLAPLERGPYYAVRIEAGDLGTKGGLLTDPDARVLDVGGRPIEGLYATGNTSASVMGPEYAGAGATIGPAMVFGWIAARHAAGV